jgi:hypothetical protein
MWDMGSNSIVSRVSHHTSHIERQSAKSSMLLVVGLCPNCYGQVKGGARLHMMELENCGTRDHVSAGHLPLKVDVNTLRCHLLLFNDK